MSRNHIFLVVLLTACLTLSMISAYHNDMFSHLENTTVPMAPALARRLGSALSTHLDNSDNTSTIAPSPIGSALSALSEHLDNNDNTTTIAPSPIGSALSALSEYLDNTPRSYPRSFLGTAAAVTILVVGVFILDFDRATQIVHRPWLRTLVNSITVGYNWIYRHPTVDELTRVLNHAEVEEEVKQPEEEKEVEKEKEKVMEKEKEKEEVHDDEAFWDDVLAKDGRHKAKSAKEKEREDLTNKRRRKWQLDSENE